ncbi:MAG: SIS domain-containing protein [Anaerolineae bacterium]|nr:SIS domain-containing protein [Anaerolineae bacterium]
MTTRSPMHQQIETLPHLLQSALAPFDETARATLDFELCTSVRRISLVGCGDSHHAAVGAELAFNQLAGVASGAFSALTFSRYQACYLNTRRPNTELVIGISVSGGVARTIEALKLGQRAGARGMAFTGSSESPLGQSAEKVFPLQLPPPPQTLPQGDIPGVRSYAASQLALYAAAIRIGEVRAALTTREADGLRVELRELADIAEATIAACEGPVREVMDAWDAPGHLVYVGAGPLYGTAMFSAAKLIEASGAPAFAQETEEWGHIQFFNDGAMIPTILIDAAGRSTGRMAEIAQSTATIGRHVIAVVPASERAIAAHAHTVLPVQGQVRECFAPLVYHIPGAMLASAYADRIGAEYYRSFGNGRSEITYDIKTSVQLEDLCC